MFQKDHVNTKLNIHIGYDTLRYTELTLEYHHNSLRLQTTYTLPTSASFTPKNAPRRLEPDCIHSRVFQHNLPTSNIRICEHLHSFIPCVYSRVVECFVKDAKPYGKFL